MGDCSCGNRTRGNNQSICGVCRRKRRDVRNKERAEEKERKLMKRLISYHHFLKNNRAPKYFRKELWKTFKPILSKETRKELKQEGW
ncbi:MAG: hypothetical protein PHE43_01530 [Candidatus Nanoarchaeia archaeon]|nr:hypothetical protein [Candidatus Nanoarchaeia archaeon]